MYSILIPFLSVWAVCHARPAYDAPTPLDRTNSSNGFPQEYLPTLRNVSGNLELPVRPESSPYVRVEGRFDGRRGIPFHRGALVMSLAVEIYWEWKDDANLPVTRPTMRRAEVPFQDLIYRAVPANTPGALMTPVGLGLAYRWILSYVLREDISSGAITASIRYDAGSSVKPVGRVEIYHQPIQNNPAASGTPALVDNLEKTLWANTTFKSVLQPGVQQDTGLQITPDEMELRWFGCICEFFFYAFWQPKHRLVTDILPVPSPGAESYRLYRQQGDHRAEDYVEVLLFPAAATLALTFQRVVEEVLIWGAGVSLGGAYSTGAFIQHGGINLAYVRIMIDGQVPRGNQPGAGSVATT